MTRTFRLWSISLLAQLAGACTLTAEDYTPELVATDAAPPTCTGGCADAAAARDEVQTGAGGTDADRPEDELAAGAAAEGGPAPQFPIGSGPVVPEDMTADIAGAADPPETVGTSGAEREDGSSGELDDLSRLPDPATLTGFAALPGPAGSATTGRGSAAPVLARTASELQDLASRPEPLVIAIASTLDVGRLDLASSKTRFGVGPDTVLLGGVAIRGTLDAPVENVILASISVRAQASSLEGDGVQLEYAHHVWIDHCEIPTPC